MGRNKKKGLDYFPFDVDLFQDILIRKLIRRQGGDAVTVYAVLLCIIYKDGYYMKWDEDLPFIISEQTGYDEDYILEVFNCCLSLGLFSKELFESDEVITSKGIQERYQKICGTLGRNHCAISEYSLISPEETAVSTEERVITSVESAQIKETKDKTKTAPQPVGRKESGESPVANVGATGERAGKVSAPRCYGTMPASFDQIDESIRWATGKADVLARQFGVDASTVLRYANEVAASWRITNEYNRQKPHTHMCRTIRRKIQDESRTRAPGMARSPSAVELRIAKERELERLERERALKVDSRAALQAYLASKGLPSDVSLVSTVGNRPPAIN